MQFVDQNILLVDRNVSLIYLISVVVYFFDKILSSNISFSSSDSSLSLEINKVSYLLKSLSLLHYFCYSSSFLNLKQYPTRI